MVKLYTNKGERIYRKIELAAILGLRASYLHFLIHKKHLSDYKIIWITRRERGFIKKESA